MIKVSALFSFLFVLGSTIQAQEVIASAGAEVESSGGSMSYTIGEMVVTSTINTEGALTQGYQQGFLTPTAIDEIPAELELSLYPNPAADYIIIESKSLSDFEQITMYDMAGKLVWSQNGNSSVDNKITVDFTGHAAGNYIIRLADSDKDQSFSYSVVKSH
ncbi:MAG: T9SS type A sorting domain-containing protein [Flavobacteriales bacterium]|nr:T9SS type A sorting domain-containing protein [Flavobacteriales bacterium]